jgi:hypothetical protein
MVPIVAGAVIKISFTAAEAAVVTVAAIKAWRKRKKKKN